MSYYSFIDSSNKMPEIKKSLTKTKFITKDDPSQDVPGYYKMDHKKCDMVDYETKLLTPGVQTKDKVQVMLKKEFDPSNYDLNYEDGLRKFQNQKTGFDYNNRDTGPGRGFGNLNISTDIRNGGASRNNTKEYREVTEGQQMFDFQFQFLDKNFQDPSHIVMSIPRGGFQTRKQNQISVNTMRSMNSKDQYKDSDLTDTIKFDY
jgi:hypothetical protein